ncbi:hypothetical protein BDF22DRAFT_740065 [Syncephalis plumigaleata]|nr:hypothetical protein BDF22DRAFT_740065 [Syncephalis plumigaleata]
MRESIMLTERGEDRQLTQVIILEHVESSDPAVIGILMEASVYLQTAQPLPSFLLDQFLLSFTHEFDMIQNTPVASTTNLTLLKSPSMSSMLSMRQALLPYSEIRDLSEQYTNMPIGASVSRYIRDIVSATRNHHAVDAGITARSMLDLESVIRALATLYGRGFVTPELAMIATEKVFTHRLRLREGIRYESTEEVIADVLRAIQPPV